MANGGPDDSARLDSWKAIAAYLNRDESTVRRWERQLGLPVRRMPGGRGASVYAFAAEIDSWLKTSRDQVAENGHGLADGGNGQAHQDTHEELNGKTIAPPPAVVVKPPSRRRWRLPLIASAALATMVIAGWRLRSAPIRVEDLGIAVTEEAVVATSRSGAQVWRYPFPSQYKIGFSEYGKRLETVGGSNPEVFVATGIKVRNGVGQTESGQLISFLPSGEVRRTFSFEDRATFGRDEYGPPWGITAFAADDRTGSRRIALAAHHFQWSASMVTLLDDRFQRHGTYWQWGWIEAVHWLAPNRLFIGGYSNPRGGMVALLDPSALDGQAPDEADARTHCSTCGTGAPMRMVVMPATEVNRAALARFNRAAVQVLPDRIVARTIEVEQKEDHAAIDVLYEFTPELDLIRASFGGGYWEIHDRLYREGKLDHPSDRCPDRDGPREVLTWNPKSGWQRLAVPRPTN
jgi:hypothetical protein